MCDSNLLPPTISRFICIWISSAPCLFNIPSLSHSPVFLSFSLAPSPSPCFFFLFDLFPFPIPSFSRGEECCLSIQCASGVQGDTRWAYRTNRYSLNSSALSLSLSLSLSFSFFFSLSYSSLSSNSIFFLFVAGMHRNCGVRQSFSRVFLCEWE